jgi:hypothetical protein
MLWSRKKPKDDHKDSECGSRHAVKGKIFGSYCFSFRCNFIFTKQGHATEPPTPGIIAEN